MRLCFQITINKKEETGSNSSEDRKCRHSDSHISSLGMVKTLLKKKHGFFTNTIFEEIIEETRFPN